MTKLFTLANHTARQLGEIKRENSHLSYSKIIDVLLKNYNHESMDRLRIIYAFDELRGTLPNLSEKDFNLLQILVIKFIKLDADQLDLARQGLGKFISDLDKIPKESD